MMTSLKMWCLLPLTILHLSITPSVTEVVQSRSECKEFFLDEIPQWIPRIKVYDNNQYKIICQTYDDKRRFVTLYDTKNKIPVFSAFKYRGDDNTSRPEERWKIEPQVHAYVSDNLVIPTLYFPYPSRLFNTDKT